MILAAILNETLTKPFKQYLHALLNIIGAGALRCKKNSIDGCLSAGLITATSGGFPCWENSWYLKIELSDK